MKYKINHRYKCNEVKPNLPKGTRLTVWGNKSCKMTHTKTISVEQSYYLAKFQRPGRVIIMGVTQAEDRQITALHYPDTTPWFLYDLKKRIGFTPSLWVIVFCFMKKYITGTEATKEEYTWLTQPNTGLIDAKHWITHLKKERTP